jgi:hypothetical protein
MGGGGTCSRVFGGLLLLHLTALPCPPVQRWEKKGPGGGGNVAMRVVSPFLPCTQGDALG